MQEVLGKVDVEVLDIGLSLCVIIQCHVRKQTAQAINIKVELRMELAHIVGVAVGAVFNSSLRSLLLAHFLALACQLFLALLGSVAVSLLLYQEWNCAAFRSVNIILHAGECSAYLIEELGER